MRIRWTDFGTIPTSDGKRKQPDIVMLRKVDNRMLMLGHATTDALADTLFSMAAGLEQQADEDPKETDHDRWLIDEQIRFMRTLARFLLGKVDHDLIRYEDQK